MKDPLKRVRVRGTELGEKSSRGETAERQL